MEHEGLTEAIIGCAYRVYNRLGFGFLESVYGKALLIELERAGLSAAAEQSVDVFYDGLLVGHFVADILVENCVILELKSVRALTTAHEVQLVNYLTATGKPVGLLMNFGERSVEVRRKLRRLPSPNPQNPVNPV